MSKNLNTESEKPSTTSSQEVVLLRSYQKTIVIRDGKVYENNTEVTELAPSSDSNPLAGDKPDDPTARGYQLVRSHYKKLISSPFENVVVLTGAGTSKSSGGKVMAELWEEAFPGAKKSDNDKFFKSINFQVPTSDEQKNLEELLSQAQKAIEVLDETVGKEVSQKIKQVEELIVKACTLQLTKEAPHLKLLNKITSRKLKYSRVKVFTLNYDTLFEQAAAEGNYIVVNGFSFSNPSYFNGTFFDYDIVNRINSRVSKEENFITKVFHLYKPHGSINWERNDQDKVVSREITSASKKPLIIYPNSNKYESGYNQPFFEMMSRFQQAVRQPNTLLLCIGFSFGDKHFKNVIHEAVKSNPGLNLIVAMPGFMGRKSIQELIEMSEKQNNITFINEDFQNLSEHYPFSLEYEHDNGEQN